MKLCPTCNEGALDSAKICPRCNYTLDANTYRPGNELHGLVLQEKYRLDKFLQEGGMGWVYRGKQLDLDRDVAVKLMKPSSKLHKHRILRFEREAWAASRLSHPHIISILDFGRTPGELLFNVTELVRGVTLTELLRYNGALPFPRVLPIFAQLLAAMEEAHSNNVIHRDLKPDNIMVTRLPSREEFIKVLDFGIAKITTTCTTPVTLVGEVCGTPAYMSPEQIRRTEITVATDIYACGVILFELLTGTVPLEGGTLEETFSMQLHDDPPPLLDAISDGSVPAEIQDLIGRAMAKSPDDRFRNMSEMRDALFGIATSVGHAGPCTACRRQPDSMLGPCSDKCGARSDQDPAAEIIFELHDAPRQERDHHEPAEPDAPKIVVTDASLNPRIATTGSVVVTDAAMAAGLNDTVDTCLTPEELSLLQPNMLNRARENDRICRFLDGDQPVLEIIGPPGTGKSTLLLEVSRQARLDDRAVLVAGPDPSLARVPWLPIQQLVRQALGLHTERLHPHVLLQRAPELGLSSDDAARLSHLFTSPISPNGEASEVFFREMAGTAVRALLSPRDGADRGCILVDGANHLDWASQRFLRLLCRVIADNPIKVVLASDKPLMPANQHHASLYLGPIKPEEIRALLKARVRLRRADLDGVLRTFTRQAAGSLLFMDQAARFHTEGGQDTAPTLESMVSWRLKRLAPSDRRLLDTLCVLGISASMERLEQIIGSPLGAARQALLRAGWLKAVPLDPVTVVHPVVAEIVCRSMDEQTRRTLHGRALKLLEHQEEQAPVLARHAYEARAGEQSLAILVDAGDLAEGAMDCETAALVHYRRALEVAQQGLGLALDDPRCLELMLKMGTCLLRSGHLLAAEMTLEEAIKSSTGVSKIHGRLLLERGRFHRIRGRLDKAEEDTRAALEMAVETNHLDLVLQGHQDLASVLLETDQSQKAREALERGIRLVARDPGAPDRAFGLWQTLIRLAEEQRDGGLLDDALETSGTALIAARDRDSRQGRARANMLRGELRHAVGDHHGAARSLHRAAALFQRLGDRQNTARCLLFLARLQPEEQRSLASRALSLSEQVQWEDGIAMAKRLRSPALSQTPIEDTN